jgi:hypothetical protein
MNEIIKIIGYVLFLILFRYISWIKLIAVSLLYNGLQYCYNNKKNLHKFIDKQNKNLTLKKAFVIIMIGIPLILVDITSKILGLLEIVWKLFIKTNIGKSIKDTLDTGDKFIIKKKNELKNQAIQYVLKRSMPGFSDNKDINLPDLGNLDGIGDLLKNPEEMGKMMESLGKMMGGLNMDKMSNNSNALSDSASVKDSNNISKPTIEDNLFARINDYIEDENTSIQNENRLKTLENKIQETKYINRKIRRRLKKNKKNNISNKEFKNLIKQLRLKIRGLLKVK